MILEGLSIIVIGDGGMGTALMNDVVSAETDLGPWWASSVLVEDPGRVERVHRQHVEAGSEVLLTCSYQAFASIPAGISWCGDSGGADDIHQTPVTCFEEGLLTEACDLAVAVADRARRAASNRRILIGGSVGPIGASLPGAREFTGNYRGITPGAVAAFYTNKVASLLHASRCIDFLAFETFPRLDEALLVLQLVQELSDKSSQTDASPSTNAIRTPCVVSFVSHDGCTLPCGSSIGHAMLSLRPFHDRNLLVGVGFNCCYPPAAYRAASALLGIKGTTSTGGSLALIWKPNISSAAAATALCCDANEMQHIDVTHPKPESDIRASFYGCTSRIMQLVARNASFNRLATTTNQDVDRYLFDRVICGGCCGTTANDIAWLAKQRDAILSEVAP